MHIIKKHNISIKKSKLYLFSFLVFSSLLSCSYNPFKKYANQYDNVVWKSTQASSVNISLYVLEKNLTNRKFSLCIINNNEINYYMVGYILDSFAAIRIDEYGKYEGELNTMKTYLRNNLYCSTVNRITEKSLSFFKNTLSINMDDYIELEMKEFDQEKEATPLMFSNVKYVSDTYSFNTIAKEREYLDAPDYDTFFVSYGSMLIDNVKTDIALKFLPENKFFIFRNDNIEDIIISGTYTNSWTDITLNFEDNKIDNNTSMKVKAEFLNNKN